MSRPIAGLPGTVTVAALGAAAAVVEGALADGAGAGERSGALGAPTRTRRICGADRLFAAGRIAVDSDGGAGTIGVVSGVSADVATVGDGCTIGEACTASTRGRGLEAAETGAARWLCRQMTTAAAHKVAVSTRPTVIRRRCRRRASVAAVRTATGSFLSNDRSVTVSTASLDGRLIGDNEIDEDDDGADLRTSWTAGGDVIARTSRAATRSAFILAADS